jgi:hypothetical protein
MTEQQERDERAIEKVLRLYALAMDTRRWDLFDDIFATDAVIRYPGMVWNDLASFKKDFADAHAGYDATQHAAMTPLVEVDGDSACSFVYTSFRLIKLGTEGGDFAEGQAWNDDRWVRTADGWRIRERSCRILWSEGNPAVRGATKPLRMNVMREEAAEGKIGFLTMYDKRTGRGA